MAKATIKLVDKPDGRVAVEIEFSPAIKDPCHSGAQQLAVSCLEVIGRATGKKEVA